MHCAYYTSTGFDSPVITVYMYVYYSIAVSNRLHEHLHVFHMYNSHGRSAPLSRLHSIEPTLNSAVAVFPVTKTPLLTK